jgi:opacity protein-like surface antigen
MLACFATSTALGLLGPSATGFTFMKIGIGARPVGMGGAYTAVADDANALFWNPAGLALNPTYGGSVTAMKLLQSVSYASGGLVAPIGRRLAVGLAGGYLSASDTRRDELGQEIGTFGLSDIAVGPGVAWQPLTGLGLGIGARYVYSRIDSFHASAFSADGGVIYQPWKHITVGASLLHLGPPRKFISEWEYPPVNLRVGVAGKIPLAGNRLILSSDLSLYPDYGPVVSAGAELYVPLTGTAAGQALYARGGYQSGSHLGTWSGFSLGIGYEYNLMENLFLGLDVVYLSYGLLGDSERASVGLRYSPGNSSSPGNGSRVKKR